MSLLLIFCFEQSYSVIGSESDLDLVKKDGYKEAVEELAKRLRPLEDFDRSLTLPIIADTILYYFDKNQAEIRSLNNYVKILQDDIQKYKNTSNDEVWVEKLKLENGSLLTENRKLKMALEKERADHSLESSNQKSRIRELEVESERLYDLLAWVGENKS
jgi:hypothetical protein